MDPNNLGGAPEPGGNGQVITVFSTKGGVGTSMVATNLAVSLAKHSPHPVALAVAAGLLTVKLTVLAAVLAAGEVFVAKLRLFRIPELLAGSFALALLAVVASYVTV